MASDTFKVEVYSDADEHFSLAFALAFYEVQKFRDPVVTHYSIDANGLTFFWQGGGEGRVMLLPYKMSVDAAREFARSYLKVAEYGPQPEHDGSNRKGWSVSTAGQPYYAVLRVKPEWMIYSK